MKVLRFAFWIILTLSAVIALNIKFGNIPPIGKFLNPWSGFWVNGEEEALNIPKNIKLEGLKDEVTIEFDALVIPHIFANNEEDLYFAQGYITAYHRLWQMEFQLYATAGRISEIIGKRALDFDRGQRRKGLTYGAKQTLKLVEQQPEIKKILDAYTKGVNAYINSLSPGKYPVEYKLLNYDPEPWNNFKSCLLLKEMADQLSRGERDLENTNLINLLGSEQFELLYPEYPDKIDPVIPVGTKFDYQPIKIDRPNLNYPDIKTPSTIKNPDPRNGSNNFAINGNKSANGFPLLANEPDLGLNLPSLWYIAHLNCDGMNVMGSTLPGLPGVIIGFNDSIAWGMTNAKRDLVDWYAIEFKSCKRNEYKYDDKWLKTQQVIEEISIRDSSTFYDTIIYTHYGPVSYDRNFKGNGEEINYAMRWTAHDPAEEIKSLWMINKASNYDDFKEGLSYYTGPPQNFAYADAKGNIAIRIPGKFPVKWREQGKFLMDGSVSEYEWAEYIPRAHNLESVNPERNFISSANQHPVDSTYPYYDYDHNFEHYRNRRINDRLKVTNELKAEDMMKLQNDNFNYIASESLPFMLDSLDTTRFDNEQKALYQNLRQWDYFNKPDITAPSVFELWSDIFYDLLWDEYDTMSFANYKPNIYNTIHLVKNYPDLPFIDRIETQHKETTRELINNTFNKMTDSLTNWKRENGDDIQWYIFKNTRVSHLLRIEPFSRDQIKIGGNHNIVNAASGTHGPSWRMVVELEPDNVKAWGVYPGSQSGNPGNPKYAHMIERWAKGEYFQLYFPDSKNENEDMITSSTTLKPE